MAAVCRRVLPSRSFLSPWFGLTLFAMFCIFELFNQTAELTPSSSPDIVRTEGGSGGLRQERLKSLESWSHHNLQLHINSTTNGELIEDLLFFARIPKSGTENLAFLMKALALRNDFIHKRYWRPQPRRITSMEQGRNVAYVLRQHARALSSGHRAFSFDRHVYFIDFRDFRNFVPGGSGGGTAKNPIWFSSIRDPVDKFVSRFYYARFPLKTAQRNYDTLVRENSSSVRGLSLRDWRRKDIERCVLDGDEECTIRTGEMHDLSIPYFCGQSDECMIVGSKLALDRAKANIDRWFPVVAVLERMTQSLRVLEHVLPKFFSGASRVYSQDLKEPHRNRGPRRLGLSSRARAKLATNLTLEYNLYTFADRRLSLQLTAVPPTTTEAMSTSSSSTTETTATSSSPSTSKQRLP